MTPATARPTGRSARRRRRGCARWSISSSTRRTCRPTRRRPLAMARPYPHAPGEDVCGPMSEQDRTDLARGVRVRWKENPLPLEVLRDNHVQDVVGKKLDQFGQERLPDAEA